MKELSIIGFRGICDEISPAVFIFDSSNQDSNTNSGIRMIARYYEIAFMLNPNKICLRNDTGILCFSKVKYIQYNNSNGAGHIFRIICGNQSDDSKDVAYTILADKNFSK